MHAAPAARFKETCHASIPLSLCLTLLTITLFLSPLLVAEAKGRPKSAEKARKETKKEQPGQKGPEDDQKEGPNDEPDPERRLRYDQRKADAVEARALVHRVVEVGRRTKSPLTLLAAAELAREVQLSRPLSQVATDPPVEGGLIQERPAAPETLDSVALLREARALLAGQNRGAAAQREALALLDRMAQMEAPTRGAVLGPQKTCDGLSPGVRLNYNIRYEGTEKAIVAIVGDGPGELSVSVTDENGNLIGRTPDRTMITWYPRWQGVFQVAVENRSQQRIRYCLETN